jgi:ribosomal protein S18 acetylase RimI-like enzyme
VPEIRRIEVPEAAAVAALWDDMCRGVPDGGPLTPAGRRNIERMLEIAAWHHLTSCLVAVEDGQVRGFVMCRLDPGDGLLPGCVGWIEEWYVPAELAGDGRLARQLVQAAVARLRQQGVRWAIRHLVDKDDAAGQELLVSLGFEADLIGLSRYDKPGDEGCRDC